MTKLFVIAHGKRQGPVWDRIVPLLRALAGNAVTLQFTSGPGDATRMAREAIGAGAGWIVAAGGDGTFNEVVNGYFGGGGVIEARTPLSFLPFGSGNDWVRTLGTPQDPLRAAAALEAARTRPVDVAVAQFRNRRGATERRAFLNFAEAGVGAQSVRHLNRLPQWARTGSVYLVTAVATAFPYQPRALELACDGAAPYATEPLLSLIVANGRFFGAGIQCAPMAQHDDGLLDVITIGSFGTLEVLRKVGTFVRGCYLGESKVTHRTVRSVAIMSAWPVPFELDGDFVGTLPATVTVLPGALQIRC